MTEWFGFKTAMAIRGVKILYNLPFKFTYIILKFTSTQKKANFFMAGGNEKSSPG